MNPTFLGDSYDLVKRFFCGELHSLGYILEVDPMFTGSWNGNEERFFRLIDVPPPGDASNAPSASALFLDPDTGVNEKGGKQHVSFERIVQEAARYNLVFSFDQSFSRQAPPREVMVAKLASLRERGCHGIYYDSHARFLFASNCVSRLIELTDHLVGLGIPPERMLLSVD